jgi:ketosteroid isomerase-like protein
LAPVNRGDTPGLATLYTQDGQVLLPDGGFVTGRQAIQIFWQVVIDMGIQGA